MTDEQKAADLKEKQDALAKLEAAAPQDATAITAAKKAVDAAQKVVDTE